jgi:hypothetical protein
VHLIYYNHHPAYKTFVEVLKLDKNRGRCLILSEVQDVFRQMCGQIRLSHPHSKTPGIHGGSALATIGNRNIKSMCNLCMKRGHKQPRQTSSTTPTK